MVDTKFITLYRQPGIGFGFNVIRRKGRPLAICMVLDGGPAKESGQVGVGDIVVSINGKDVSEMLTGEAISYIKHCNEKVDLELIPNNDASHMGQNTPSDSILLSSLQSGSESGFTDKEAQKHISQISTIDTSVVSTNNQLQNKTSNSLHESYTSPQKCMCVPELVTLPQNIIKGSRKTNNFNLDVDNTLDWTIDFAEECVKPNVGNQIECESDSKSGRVNNSGKNISKFMQDPVMQNNRLDSLSRDIYSKQIVSVDSGLSMENPGSDFNNYGRACSKDDDLVWIKVSGIKKTTSAASLKNRTIVRRSLRDSSLNHICNNPCEGQGNPSHLKEIILNNAYDTTEYHRITTADNTKIDKLSCESNTSILKGAPVDSYVDDLAQKMYNLDGYDVNDIAKNINGKSEYARKLGSAYLGLYNFKGERIDNSLRSLLKRMTITGETQDRERVLQHFSRRYYEDNPTVFDSEDQVHTIACALMLLNSDLHGENIGKKMTFNDFVKNLPVPKKNSSLGRDILKELYYSVKESKLEWALNKDNIADVLGIDDTVAPAKPDMAIGNITFKEGQLRCKFTESTDGRRRRRKWKQRYLSLRGTTLYILKNYSTTEIGSNEADSISLLHAYALRCSDYKGHKRDNIFKLTTSDWKTFLFEAANELELEQWLLSVNVIAARYSSPPLLGGVGNSKKFVRPMLPIISSTLSTRSSLQLQLEELYDAPASSRDRSQQKVYNIEKQKYLRFEASPTIDRINTYILCLTKKNLKMDRLLAKILNDEATDSLRI
ncbi:PH and SEC7 domain-containing protein 2 [Trichoplax sp. H2]|nr:PH and SEC7 domain-containing protein 2 [Trichoplax sp. H2]|eukprot:RDD37179.1 PH and SEC7 domain-containing protein 2 [Trichoplax sp. H2]